MNTFYTLSGTCMYTTQGDIICKSQADRRVQEGFTIDEAPNIPTTEEASTKNEVVEMALSKGYCKVQTSKDPTTGETKYEFSKKC